jgi:hypothetical protein
MLGMRLGMQAGRALPQARWTNPHRIIASGRNSARITNAAPCGQLASADGAANPAIQGIVEREVRAANREEGDHFAAILLRAVCSRAHAVAVCPSRTLLPPITGGSIIPFGSTLPSCLLRLLVLRFPSHM